MEKYEAMVIIKADLSEAQKKLLLSQINDAVIKNNGNVVQANMWAEKRKFYFPIKKSLEGIYYLLIFNAAPEVIDKIRQVYKLNENILRILITKVK